MLYPVVVPPTTRPSPASLPEVGGARAVRLGWLDALRGWAAVSVALHHASFYYIPNLRAKMGDWVDPGRYGVLLFFLVSGYIVPVSLERHGDVRRFWISRFFRIYPLFVAVCLVPVALALLGVRELRAGLGDEDPLVATLAHLTMLQDVLAVPNAVNVLWTLSYEMTFYLLVVALYVTGAARRSAGVAAFLIAAALAAAAATVPYLMLSRAAGTGPVVLAAATALAGAVAAAMFGPPRVRAAGGVLGGLTALALVVANSRIAVWEGLVILAVMFTGTAIYRAEHRQTDRRIVLAVALAVLGGAVAVGTRYAWTVLSAAQIPSFQRYWTGSLLLAAATFGAGWLLRRHRFPRWLTGLGAISYSVYLLHHVMLMLSDELFGFGRRDRPAWLAVYLVVLVVLSCLTHRWIEVPAQRLGHRLARRGAAPPPAPDPVPAAV